MRRLKWIRREEKKMKMDLKRREEKKIKMD